MKQNRKNLFHALSMVKKAINTAVTPEERERMVLLRKGISEQIHRPQVRCKRCRSRKDKTGMCWKCGSR